MAEDIPSGDVIFPASEDIATSPDHSSHFHSVSNGSEPATSHFSVLPCVSDLFFSEPIGFKGDDNPQEPITVPHHSIWRPTDGLRESNYVTEEDLNLVCDPGFDDRHCSHSPDFENGLPNTSSAVNTAWFQPEQPKFSDILPILNSDQSQQSYADQMRTQSSNFSVGYLIGGGGRGLIRDPSGGCSSSSATPRFPSPLLSSLPTSDCLSLAPISDNSFNETSGQSSWGCVHEAFQQVPETGR